MSVGLGEILVSALLKDARRAAAEARDVAIKEALGRWVSELEPVLVYNQHMQFIGLMHAGQELGGYPTISVFIKDGIPV